ncbi:thioredoxin domain-containing protein [Paenibacillus thermoaerophilus]|uniref:Thioredoxin domain-containing protein n=1 Tax=Paenibacillus thermoaerophilus TaxID=1215385 RepID=A0ABW2V479_9BACL|nr:thioredoxin domain-containing protein [Paenibacillus thermoaerophilus]
MEINEGGTVDGNETGNGRYDGTHHSNEQNRFGGFLGSWCEPCRMIAPVLDQLASEMKGEAVYCQKNVDENPISSFKYQVQSIPTLKLFVNGWDVQTFVGLQPLQSLKAATMQYAN